MVQEIIDEGADPKVIDLNLRNNLVEVMSNVTSELSFGFQDSLRPNGGLKNNGAIIPGNWCNGSTDLGGGGCGRVARSFMNIAQPNNLLYFKNIKEFGVIGSCYNDVYDDWAFGLIEVSDVDFWHYKQDCENSKPLCLTAQDQQDYLDVLEEIEDSYLPQGYMRIGFNIASYNFFPSYPYYNYYWYFYYKVGIPVYDNNE